MLEGREWHGVPGAAPEALETLRAIAPAGVPASYYSLLSFSDGGEGPLPVQPLYFCLYSSAEVVRRQRGADFGQSEFDEVFIIGGNGGGEYIALDLRQSQPWPIVYIDMVAGLESAELVAPDFDSFLAMVGHEET